MPHAFKCVKTCFERACWKLCPLFAFVFHVWVVVFPNGEGLRHLWLLSTIARVIAMWLGALSRSHSKQAHPGGIIGLVRCREKAQGGLLGPKRPRTMCRISPIDTRVKCMHPSLQCQELLDFH